jgi:non-specific serine/threonine protein kinase
MLETVREFGLELLAESGEEEHVGQRHAELFGALADPAEEGLVSAEQASWLHVLDRDHENYRAALRWALARGQAALAYRLGWGLWRFWDMHGWETEGRRWLRAALALPVPAEVDRRRQRVAWAAGQLAYQQGDSAEARALLDECLATARERGDEEGIGMALTTLGHVAFLEDDLRRAAACYAEGLAIRRQLGDQRGTAISLQGLGFVARMQGDNARAQSLLEEALRLFRAADDRFQIGLTTGYLADAVFAAGDLPRSRWLLLESLDVLRALGARSRIPRCLERWAAFAVARGRAAVAVRLAGAADALRAVLGDPLSAAQLAERERILLPTRSALSAEAAKQEWALGRAMTMEEAIDLALGVAAAPAESPRATPPEPAPDPSFPLTVRQRDVAALVARGLTNQEIANALVVSPRTAETHVQNILTKLDLTSRAQLAVWAHRHGVLAIR